MTRALCLNCGHIKIGALCPCPKCSAGPTGTPALDIIFSDHSIAADSLTQLGAVIAEINRRSDDQELCRTAFYHYVATHHPSILEVQLPEAETAACQRLIDRAELPSVTITTVTHRRGYRRASTRSRDFSLGTVRWWFILPLVIIAAGFVYLLAQETPLKISLADGSDLTVLFSMLIAAAYLAFRLRRSFTARDADKE